MVEIKSVHVAYCSRWKKLFHASFLNWTSNGKIGLVMICEISYARFSLTSLRWHCLGGILLNKILLTLLSCIDTAVSQAKAPCIMQQNIPPSRDLVSDIVLKKCGSGVWNAIFLEGPQATARYFQEQKLSIWFTFEDASSNVFCIKEFSNRQCYKMECVCEFLQMDQCKQSCDSVTV